MGLQVERLIFRNHPYANHDLFVTTHGQNTWANLSSNSATLWILWYQVIPKSCGQEIHTSNIVQLQMILIPDVQKLNT